MGTALVGCSSIKSVSLFMKMVMVLLMQVHFYEEGELMTNSTCRKFRQVCQEGNRMVLIFNGYQNIIVETRRIASLRSYQELQISFVYNFLLYCLFRFFKCFGLVLYGKKIINIVQSVYKTVFLVSVDFEFFAMPSCYVRNCLIW